jgi:hypothetical protein
VDMILDFSAGWGLMEESRIAWKEIGARGDSDYLGFRVSGFFR